jgi:CheY-like chemotaxis protein
MSQYWQRSWWALALWLWSFGRLDACERSDWRSRKPGELRNPPLDDILPMPLDRRIEVLYVEDSAGDVLIMGHVLREFLHSVNLSIARDGAQALAMLADEHFIPDLIILDLDLPVLSGFEVLQQNARKDIPIIVFSASARTSDVERTLSLGAKEYIHKPIDLQSYRVAVLGMVCNWAMPEQDANGAVTT